MKICLEKVNKYYGSFCALNNISFSIPKGEIVGILGPNGAGKSTLMNIISGSFPFSSGAVNIAGLNLQDDPIPIKRITGYLPENNPLELDLYIRESLFFFAKAYSTERHRVGEVIDKVGLRDQLGKKIRNLSKGYRQRVGIAQAIIHQPDVLILDEPTNGLDPNQIQEIRSLIRSIGKEKTVLLSSHLLQEIEAVCDRVLILDHGCLLFDSYLKDLDDSLESIFTKTTKI